jgi:hypothetical protein
LFVSKYKLNKRFRRKKMKTFRFLITVTVMLLVMGINTVAETVPAKENAVTGTTYLSQFVGNWTGTASIWEKSDAEPFKAPFVATSQMILGGNFLETRVLGNIVGMPFEGLQIVGYSESTDKYPVQWIDSLTGTDFCIYEGTLDETGKIRIDTAKCPICNEELTQRTVTEFIDDDHLHVTMYTSGGQYGSEEFKNLEVTYTRTQNN